MWIRDRRLRDTHTAHGVGHALSAIEGVGRVDVNPQTGGVLLHYHPGDAPRDEILSWLCAKLGANPSVLITGWARMSPANQYGAWRDAMAQLMTITRRRLLPWWPVRVPDPAFSRWWHVAGWDLDLMRRRWSWWSWPHDDHTFGCAAGDQQACRNACEEHFKLH
jgi:hypothetical protein